jgi:dolichyl-phosphate-mannose--protein O-mannosyl transferase
LIASGASFGAAIAVKWSAVPFLLVAAALAYRWEIRHDSRADPRRARPGWPAQRAARARPGWPAQRAARAQCLVIAAFVLVPAIVYLVSYATFFVQHGPDLRGFLRLQRAMADYGLHFHNQSPDQTAPWTWPFVFRPINYTGGVFFQGGISIVDGRVRVIRVLALGNPIVWWAFLAAVPLVAWRAIATRRGPGALVLVGYLVVWLPWLVISRTAFGYYMLPAVPFMGLAVATAMTALGPRGRAGAAAALAAAATIAAALYLPLWTAAPMSVQRFTQLHHLPGVR